MVAGHLGRDAGPDPRRGRARVQDAGRRRALSPQSEADVCELSNFGEEEGASVLHGALGRGSRGERLLNPHHMRQ